MSFIDEIADRILKSHAHETRSLAVVLPGRRSCLFLKKSLALRAAKPMLLPAIMSIEEYIFAASGLSKPDETTLLTQLYTVYKEAAGDKAFPLDDFLATGKTLLADFNDVDDYLLDPDEVFTYLYRIREIEGWVPGNSDTMLQNKYLEFYSLMKPIYQQFTSRMLKAGHAWQGLASRMLASQEAAQSEFSHVIFAGLNAVTPSLAGHINRLRMAEKAELIWDTDEWYVGNPNHEAGHFMRMNKLAWPETFPAIGQHFSTGKKKLDIIGAPMGFAQIQTGLSLLNEKYSDAFAETVMVLADESLLMPLLSSLPPEWAEKVNISTGYPLRNTLLGQLMLAGLELYTQSFSEAETTPVYRFDPLVKFISNPLLRLLQPENKRVEFAEVTSTISSGRIRFFRWNPNETEKADALLLRSFDTFLPDTLSPVSSWDQCVLRLGKLADAVFDVSREVDLEHEAAWMVSNLLKTLHNTLLHYHDQKDITLNAVMYFLKRQLQMAKIPLKGEPLQGIQILGMLETRALDFKNVIVLGVNEGFLPAGGHLDTFLPLDVRRELGLPLPYERDAVYAYHFYRLMQRASEITLIYNTESDPLYGKEPSRYLAQIEHELIPAHQDYEFNKKVLDIQYKNVRSTTFPLPPREVIDAALGNYAENGLSFSRFFTFVECPCQFMLSSILNIKEFEEETGDIPYNVMGSIFHLAIENVTKPFLNQVLSAADIDTMIASADEQLNVAMKEFKIPHPDRGYNYLVSELLHDSLRRWLNGLKSNLGIGYTVAEVECDLDYQLQLSDGRNVRLKGKADRVESLNGKLRVMDFKTTHNRYSFKLDDKPIEDSFTPKGRYLIQVMFYAWLYQRKTNCKDLSGGVYSVLNNNGHIPDLISDKSGEPLLLDHNLLNEFEETVRAKLDELFSPEQAFQPQPVDKVCNNCAYNGVLCFANLYGNLQDEA